MQWCMVGGGAPKPTQISEKVKSGSIVDFDGFIRHVKNEELPRKILKAFKECGLMNFLFHNYPNTHKKEAIELYLNAWE